jgi:hypothetical protein
MKTLRSLLTLAVCSSLVPGFLSVQAKAAGRDMPINRVNDSHVGVVSQDLIALARSSFDSGRMAAVQL